MASSTFFVVSFFILSALTAASYHRRHPNAHPTRDLHPNESRAQRPRTQGPRPRYSAGTRSVCYPGVGCFNTAYPFNNTGEVPQDPLFINTRFNLHTREHPTEPERLRVGDRGSLLNSAFDANNPVKFIIHGFLATGSMIWVKNITREFLTKEATNVIVVDWGRGAGFPYVQAAANTRLVGALLANLIVFLNYETGSNQAQYQLIGHSLGAHISGYAGQRVRGIGRITGLDPAQPNFQGESPMVRLDPSDADYVEVIHTNGSPYDTLGGFGMLQAVGHVDFYPNGGMQQPGCPQDGWSSFVSSAYSSGVEEAELTVGCNHNRAPEYFMESINSPCPFTAYPCPSYLHFKQGRCVQCDGQCPSMAGQPTSYRGSAYLLTNPHSPFCGYHYAVSIQLTDDMQETQGVVRARIHGNNGQTQIVQVYSGIINPGDTLRSVFLSVSDIGSSEDVHIAFERVYGYLEYLDFWGTNNVIKVQQVTTVNMEDNQSKVFCPTDETVRNGGGVWLSRGLSEGRSQC